MKQRNLRKVVNALYWFGFALVAISGAVQVTIFFKEGLSAVEVPAIIVAWVLLSISKFLEETRL